MKFFVDPQKKYWFAIRSKDQDGFISDISNIAIANISPVLEIIPESVDLGTVLSVFSWIFELDFDFLMPSIPSSPEGFGGCSSSMIRVCSQNL